MSSIGKLMRQANRLQQEMKRVQDELANKTVEGSSGGGAVKVVVKCDQTLASIKIDPSAVSPSDVSILEDLVLSAVNQALNLSREVASKDMAAVTSGYNLPGMI
jgi:DNA-binding YbaB/EbfC family protein